MFCGSPPDVCGVERVRLSWNGHALDLVPVDKSGSFTATVLAQEAPPSSSQATLGAMESRREQTNAEPARSALPEPLYAEASFAVTPAPSLTITSAGGRPGDRVTVRGANYWRCLDKGVRAADVRWNGVQTADRVIINDDGSLTADIVVPLSAPGGSNEITVTCDATRTQVAYVVSVDPTVVPSPTTAPAGGDPTTATTPPAPPTALPSPTGLPRSFMGDALSRGWPRPKAIAAIHMAGQPGFSIPQLLVMLVILALLAWFLVGWPAELLHRTYAHNKEVIHRWLRIDRPARQGRHGRMTARLPRDSWLTAAAFLVLASAALTFSQGTWSDGRTDWPTAAVSFLALLVAVPLVVVGYEFAIESCHRRHAPYAPPERLGVVYPALAFAVLCAVMSWMFGFVPGYGYGLVIAYSTVSSGSATVPRSIVAGRVRSRRDDGVAVLQASLGLLALAWLCWTLRQFMPEAVTTGDEAMLLPRLIDTTLCQIMIMSLEVLIIGLAPLEMLRGRKLFLWNRYLWLGVYVMAAASFVVILLGPLQEQVAGGTQSVWEVSSVARMIWLFLAFFGASVVFAGVFKVRALWVDRSTGRGDAVARIAARH